MIPEMPVLCHEALPTRSRRVGRVGHIARRITTVEESDGYPAIFVQAETPGGVHDLRPGRRVNVDTVP